MRRTDPSPAPGSCEFCAARFPRALRALWECRRARGQTVTLRSYRHKAGGDRLFRRIIQCQRPLGAVRGLFFRAAFRYVRDMKFTAPEWRERVASTNTVLRSRIRAGEPVPDGTVLAAQCQTAGRGRFDRAWASGAGEDLTFSFTLRVGDLRHDVATLAMAVALGVSDYLRRVGVDARTKWPNDVLVGPRKICGILAERCTGPENGTGMIVGVGLNVNMRAGALAAIDRPATSLAVETGERYEPAEMLQPLLVDLAARITPWQRRGFAVLRKDWEARCRYVGERIVIEDAGRMWQGMLRGFGKDGELLLAQGDGITRRVWSGDVVHARLLEQDNGN